MGGRGPPQRRPEFLAGGDSFLGSVPKNFLAPRSPIACAPKARRTNGMGSHGRVQVHPRSC